MDGPFCSSCGASVQGVRFCTACGTQVPATEPDPYEYLFAEPAAADEPAPEPPVPTAPTAPYPPPAREFPTAERTAIRVGWGQLPAGPVVSAPRRTRFGWPWVAAAAVVLLAVVGLGISLLGGSHHTSGSLAQPGSGDAGSTARSTTPHSAAPSHAASTSPRGGAHAPARVAAQVRGLLAQEVAAHQADNAAVGAMLSCANPDRNRRTIASFALTRHRLAGRLAAVPSSGNAQLDAVARRLLGTWRSLEPVDRAYARWARDVHRTHHKCDVPAAPHTSQASKSQRRQVRDQWVAVLRAHSGWGVPQVRPLAHGALAYLLL